MISPIQLRQASIELCPDIESILSHEDDIAASTWQDGIETGKAIELLSLCSMVSAWRSLGHTAYFPELYSNNPSLFYLRNVLPRHHGAQAGHKGAAAENLPLSDRFIASITAKVRFETASGLRLSVYREGFPIHQIESCITGQPAYLDRPDIIVVDGEVKISNATSTELAFKYCSSAGESVSVLRIKNDIQIPLKSHQSRFPNGILVHGIVECSVGKGKDQAEEQLTRYRRLFANRNKILSMLINGKIKRCPAYDFQTDIDLKNSCASTVKELITWKMKEFSSALIGAAELQLLND